MYTQNKEEEAIIYYFGQRKGKLLDIGANDGKTFSNSLRLIELGWQAVLVDPSPRAFAKLEALHEENANVTCLNIAIGEKDGKVDLFESGDHLPDKSDVAMLSTIKPEEKDRWGKMDFTPLEVIMLTYKSFQDGIGNQTFDFISIDAEGMDFEILQQIDLEKTDLICVEWNLNAMKAEQIMKYAAAFGLKQKVYESPENLILGR